MQGFRHRNCVITQNNLMAIKKSNSSKPSRDRINLSELYEVKDWSKKFSINAKDIRRAVTEVWNNALDFELNWRKKTLTEI